MDFAFSQEQAALRELAGKIFDDHGSDNDIKDFERSDQPFDRALWRTLADAGLLGAAIPEEYGGSDLGVFSLAALLENQGRTVTQVPLLQTLVSVALPLAAYGTAQQREHLRAIASGDLIATAALEQPGGMLDAQPILQARPSGNSWRLNGQLGSVSYANEADLLLVPASDGADILLCLVPAGATGLDVAVQTGTSGEPLGVIELSDLEITGDMLLGGTGNGRKVLDLIVQYSQAGLCAMQVGLTAEALRRTASYTAEREQFGRPIGSMQAVQQRAADGFIDVETMRSAMMRAFWLLDQGKPDAAELSVAKYWAAIGGHRVSHTAQHLHGGMGADVTYPIHRFLLTAKRIELALGGATPTLAHIGRQIAAAKTRPLAAIGDAIS